MPERPWEWWAGLDNERFQVGPCATRQEAVDRAIADEVFTEIEPDPEGGHPDWRIRITVVEATKYEVTDVTLDASRILEDLSDNQYEMMDPEGDGNLFDVTGEDVKDLDARLNAAFHEWAKDKRMNNWAFRDTRNEEDVYLPHPSPTQGLTIADIKDLATDG